MRGAKQPLPTNGTADELHGVAGPSAKEAWAVGSFVSTVNQALALHCC